MKAQNRNRVRSSVFATSALVLMLAASFATAGPLVTEWGYSTSVTFSNATWNQGTNGAPYGDGTTFAAGNELSRGLRVVISRIQIRTRITPLTGVR